MKKINVIDLKPNSNVICLDEKFEYDKNYIKGSICIPYDTILNNYRELLKKDVKYYFYCKNGVKSKRLTSILEYLGYDVAMIEKN